MSKHFPASAPKRWHIAPPAPPEVTERLRAYHPVMAQVLYNRGQETSEKARIFLEGSEAALHNPFTMHDMSAAVARIRHAIKRGELIVVYGDFDADGVTSTALLTQTLEVLGARVQPYIPHRIEEGYGLNVEALRKLHEAGVRLVITVDCGIRSVEEVAYGRTLGLDVIVTDHHSVGDELPPARAVVNPKVDARLALEEGRRGYPEDMLAGVGVAYKLAEALFRAETQQSRYHPNLELADLLDLVALGTVADLAPLNRLENRELVRRGLRVLNRAQRPGIYELMQVAHVEPGKINTTSIGFTLGPRINAAGRLASAMIAYRLLRASMPEAGQLAQQLHVLNIDRQEKTLHAVEQARAEVRARDGDAPLIFAVGGDFQAGIVGLVAGRLCEEFYLPVVVLEQSEETSRGSCRSIPEFNITRALDRCADLLTRHGGHAQAAGFTVPNENVPALRTRLLTLAKQALEGEDLRPTLHVDAEVPFDELTMALARELRRLEPTGAGNPPPLLLTREVRVLGFRRVGRDKRHLRLKLSGAGATIDAIAFNLGHWAEQMPSYIDVVHRLEVNEWNGHPRLQMNVQDLRLAEHGE